MSKVHAEIEYFDNDRSIGIHSDVCPPGCDFNNIDTEYREHLHALLDEWLDKSKGTGGFYIKSEGFHFSFYED